MPTVIGRDELRKLTSQEAQLVEVLPADEYDWAHLRAHVSKRVVAVHDDRPGPVQLPGPGVQLLQRQVDRARREGLASAAPEAEAGSVMRFGVSTVRPSEGAAALAHRMGHAEVTRVVVTRSDGTLVGLFFAADLPS
jgi:CBS-domain-containing membrane protein